MTSGAQSVAKEGVAKAGGPSSSPPSPLRLATPHGQRSCGVGGTWSICHSKPAWSAQLAAVQQLTLNQDDFRLLKRELARLWKLAETGDLEYGKDKDVNKMQTGDMVLEMRFRHHVGYPEGKRAVRLYFTEPDHEPDVMLAVSLGAKPATEAGLDLQNDHIAEAQARIVDHFTR